MAETVKIPGAGPVKRQWVYVGGALLIGVVGYAYYKRTRAPVVEPINSDALPEDRVPFTDAQVSSGLGVSQTAGAPVTVADWVRQATDRLIELGADPQLIASALGRYVTHQQLTISQADLVRQAVGQLGYPANDAGSYPVLLAPAAPPSPPPPGGTKTRAKTAANATWIGHRLTSPRTMSQLSAIYSASRAPTGIYATLKAMDSRNPALHKRYGNNRPMPAGTIVLIPTWR